MIFKRVVLPDPLGPKIEMNVPEEAQHSGSEVEVEDNTVTGPADITVFHSLFIVSIFDNKSTHV